MVRFPTGGRDFSLLQIIQTGSRAHPVSYSKDNGEQFPGIKLSESELSYHVLLGRSFTMRGGILPLPIILHYMHRDNCTFTFIDNAP
jgi:hypothetical protein